MKRNQSSNLTYKIAKLWGSPEGTTEKHLVDAALTFDPEEIIPLGNLQAKLMIIKLKDELSVIISDAIIDIETICPLCLKKGIGRISIPGAERQFLANKPDKIDDINDLFLIDLKPMTIDLYEMVRQEIILHFAPFPVCSDSCKGLCQHCGSNKNEKPCKCIDEGLDVYQPFKNLKEMIKKGSIKENKINPVRQSPNS